MSPVFASPHFSGFFFVVARTNCGDSVVSTVSDTISLDCHDGIRGDDVRRDDDNCPDTISGLVCRGSTGSGFERRDGSGRRGSIGQASRTLDDDRGHTRYFHKLGQMAI